MADVRRCVCLGLSGTGSVLSKQTAADARDAGLRDWILRET